MKHLKPSLTQWIFIGMGVGLLVGGLYPDIGVTLRPLSSIFLRLIKSIIAPLIFSTLVVGIAGHGDLKQVGRMGIKSLLYFEIVTTLALVIGLAAVNLIKPGVGVQLPLSDHASDIVAKKQSFAEIITHIVPQSVVQAAAEGEVLQIVVFTLIFSFALAMIPHEKRTTLLGLCDALAETMFKFTGIVMRYAPIGVGAAIAVTVASKGLSVLINLGLLILTMYGALVVFVVVVFGGVAFIARIPVMAFFRAIKEPAL